MELLIFVGFVGLIIGAIVLASFGSRPTNRQAGDMAAGSNKPDGDDPKA